MSKRMTGVVLLAAVAGVVVVAHVAPSEAQVPGQQMKPVTRVLEGNYRVHYDLTFMDKSGANGKMELVKRIEFHPEYVVLIDQNGAGRLIPVHAVKHLTWNRS